MSNGIAEGKRAISFPFFVARSVSAGRSLFCRLGVLTAGPEMFSGGLGHFVSYRGVLPADSGSLLLVGVLSVAPE